MNVKYWNGGTDKMKYSDALIIPKAPAKESSSMERYFAPVTPGAPNGMTFEELIAKGSSTGFFGEIKRLIKSVVQVVKKPSKQNIIVLAAALIAIILWAWTKYSPGFNYMMPEGLKGVMAVLTGSFNNVPARILHFSAITTLVTAYGPSLIKGNVKPITGNLKTAFGLAQRILRQKGNRMYVTLLAAGVGMFTANYMMRNNSQNKYMACLTLGLMVLLSTGGLFNATFVKLIKAAYQDIAKFLKKGQEAANYQIAVQLGFGSGLILSYLACIIRGMSSNSITDNIAYIFGVIMIVAAIVLMIVQPGKEAKV